MTLLLYELFVGRERIGSGRRQTGSPKYWREQSHIDNTGPELLIIMYTDSIMRW